jgi:hypothetical protein
MAYYVFFSRYNLPCSRLILSILFETDVNSSALQWLPPEQTAGCKHPYLFSQCQVNSYILTRKFMSAVNILSLALERLQPSSSSIM